MANPVEQRQGVRAGDRGPQNGIDAFEYGARRVLTGRERVIGAQYDVLGAEPGDREGEAVGVVGQRIAP